MGIDYTINDLNWFDRLGHFLILKSESIYEGVRQEIKERETKFMNLLYLVSKKAIYLLVNLTYRVNLTLSDKLK